MGKKNGFGTKSIEIIIRVSFLPSRNTGDSTEVDSKHANGDTEATNKKC